MLKKRMLLEGKEHLSLRLRNFQFIPSHQKRQKMKVVEILTKSHCGNRRQIQRTPTLREFKIRPVHILRRVFI